MSLHTKHGGLVTNNKRRRVIFTIEHTDDRSTNILVNAKIFQMLAEIDEIKGVDIYLEQSE